jgi:hypothetical protein
VATRSKASPKRPYAERLFRLSERPCVGDALSFVEQSCRSGACLQPGDSVGSVCQRCSQKLHHIRFSGATVHQADMAVGRSNRKARRGQWCAVSTCRPASLQSRPRPAAGGTNEAAIGRSVPPQLSRRCAATSGRVHQEREIISESGSTVTIQCNCRRNCAYTSQKQCSKSPSLNHLVSDGEHAWGHLDAECSRRLEIYNKLEFGRL